MCTFPVVYIKWPSYLAIQLSSNLDENACKYHEMLKPQTTVPNAVFSFNDIICTIRASPFKEVESGMVAYFSNTDSIRTTLLATLCRIYPRSWWGRSSLWVSQQDYPFLSCYCYLIDAEQLAGSVSLVGA